MIRKTNEEGSKFIVLILMIFFHNLPLRKQRFWLKACGGILFSFFLWGTIKADTEVSSFICYPEHPLYHAGRELTPAEQMKAFSQGQFRYGSVPHLCSGGKEKEKEKTGFLSTIDLFKKSKVQKQSEEMAFLEPIKEDENVSEGGDTTFLKWNIFGSRGKPLKVYTGKRDLPDKIPPRRIMAHDPAREPRNKQESKESLARNIKVPTPVKEVAYVPSVYKKSHENDTVKRKLSETELKKVIQTVKKTPNADVVIDEVTQEIEEPNYIYYVASDEENGFEVVEDIYGEDFNYVRKQHDLTGEGITVAIIDTGVYFGHPDLVYTQYVNEQEIPNNNKDDDNNGFVDDVSGWNFFHGNNDPKDEHGHGTRMAGIIASEKMGIAPNAKIMPLRVCDEQGKCEAKRIIKALEYAREQQADIVLVALGSPYYSQIVRMEIEQLVKAGIPVIASAGNNSSEELFFPAAYPEVIAVSSTDKNGNIAGFANYNQQVDFLAPGVDILSPNNIGKYSLSSGTSESAAIIAGTLVLAREKFSETVSWNEILSAAKLSALDDFMPDLIVPKTDIISEKESEFVAEEGVDKNQSGLGNVADTEEIFTGSGTLSTGSGVENITDSTVTFTTSDAESENMSQTESGSGTSAQMSDDENVITQSGSVAESDTDTVIYPETAILSTDASDDIENFIILTDIGPGTINLQKLLAFPESQVQMFSKFMKGTSSLFSLEEAVNIENPIFTTQSISIDVVDSGGNPVSSPAIQLGSVDFSFSETQTASGVLATPNQIIRVYNQTPQSDWSVSIGLTEGSAALWRGGSQSFSPFDTLTIDPSDATVVRDDFGSVSGINIGNRTTFTESVTSIELFSSAGAEAYHNYDFTGVDLEQLILPEQKIDDYSLSLTITIVN